MSDLYRVDPTRQVQSEHRLRQWGVPVEPVAIVELTGLRAPETGQLLYSYHYEDRNTARMAVTYDVEAEVVPGRYAIVPLAVLDGD